MHDAWFVGFTPELATGVWVGYDSERSLGKDQTGGHVSAPIFLAYMQAALGDSPIHDFPVPEGIAFVSMEPGTGRLASPDSTSAMLECFKQGTEPHLAAREEPLFDDDLERAVNQLRTREQNDLDGDAEFAPPTAGHDDRAVRPDADDGTERPRIDIDERGIDRRPAPRAEDYIAPRGAHHDQRYEQQPSRNEAEAGEYRAERRPRHGDVHDDVKEEPLGGY
jgi:membrane peptidoglycan carboxypeptidase